MYLSLLVYFQLWKYLNKKSYLYFWMLHLVIHKQADSLFSLPQKELIITIFKPEFIYDFVQLSIKYHLCIFVFLLPSLAHTSPKEGARVKINNIKIIFKSCQTWKKLYFGHIISPLLHLCLTVYKGLLEKVCCDLKLLNLFKSYVRSEKSFRINFSFLFRLYRYISSCRWSLIEFGL